MGTHPIPGRKKEYHSKAINDGLNKDISDNRDDRYVRCKQCGYLCNLDRDNRAPEGSQAGDGIDLTETYGTESRINPTVTEGCPFCGSLLYG